MTRHQHLSLESKLLIRSKYPVNVAVLALAAAAFGVLPAAPAAGQTVNGEPTADAATAWAAATRPAHKPQKPHKARVAAARVFADGAHLSGGAEATEFRLSLSEGVRLEVFTLGEPYRVVIDLPDVAFRLPAGTGKSGAGLISAFRYGLLADRRARIVLDATGPVAIVKAEMAPAKGGRVDLVVALQPTDAASFGQGTGPKRDEAATKGGIFDDSLPTKPKAAAKPVVVIDPGHGGIDPGALGATNLLEKNIVLAVAREIKTVLQAGGRYEVLLTRSKDVFVSLDQRVRFSRKNAADLFISIHADATDIKSVAARVRGATVYTLSERASDEQARLMAEKENASDLVAGLASASGERTDEVRNILIDLMKRETADFSSEFSHALVKRLGKSLALSRDPQRSAAFKVLKQTDAPSVLVELGYMSNPEDEKLMGSAEWQRQVSRAIGNAVDSFFAKHTTR